MLDIYYDALQVGEREANDLTFVVRGNETLLPHLSQKHLNTFLRDSFASIARVRRIMDYFNPLNFGRTVLTKTSSASRGVLPTEEYFPLP